MLLLIFTAEIHTLNLIQFKTNYAPPHLSLEYRPQSNSDEGSFPLSLFKIRPPPVLDFWTQTNIEYKSPPSRLNQLAKIND